MGGMMIKQIKKILYITLIGIFLLADEMVAFAATKAVYEDNEESKENKVYRGVVNTDGLNVRSAAGHTNPIMKVNGKSVILKKQDEVAVLDKVTVSNGKTWYKISFQWGDTLVVGYVNGTYVKLTTDVITPLSSSEISSAKLKKQDDATTSMVKLQGGEKVSGIIAFLVVVVTGVIGSFVVWKLFGEGEAVWNFIGLFGFVLCGIAIFGSFLRTSTKTAFGIIGFVLVLFAIFHDYPEDPPKCPGGGCY